MDIVELMHALEGALGSRPLPGHEAAERDAVLRELQRRLLDAYERAPRPRAPIRLRLVRD